MNLTVEPRIEKGTIANRVSAYNPSDLVKKRFAQLRSDMATADEIRNKTYNEFNDRSLLTYQDDCQKAFNNYVPPKSDAPAEKWKANTIRPLTRNKVISIAAHVTAQILQPTVLAQNKDSKEDKQAALVMKDLMDYVLDESKYARHFVSGVISALVNPVIIFEQGFTEVKRKFKEITAEGWKEVEKIDEVFSGFFTSLVPTEEFFIGNFNEPDLQKQPFVIRRKIIDYKNAKIKYNKFDEFKYVQKGVRVFFSEQDNSFYESEDDALSDRKVEEITYYNRFADLELIIVNGVLMGSDPDRPMQRLDKLYPFAKSGYEQFDEQCFYYKSLVDKIAPDQNVIDRLYNMVIDGTFLRLFPPTANYGAETYNSKVLIPGAVFHKRDPNSRLESILPQQDIAGGLNMLQKVEASASESSQDPMQAGQATKGSQTAFEVARLEENARTVLGLFGKSLGFLAEDIGTLCVGSIIQNMTVAEVEETTSDGAKLIFKSILILERNVNGKKMPHRVDFEMFNEEAPIDDRFKLAALNELQQRVLQMSMKVKEEGEREGVTISKVNPEAFRALKFKVKAGSDFMKPSSEAIIKALNLEAYDRMINNPLLNQEEVTRTFLLGTYVPNKEDKFIAKQPEQPIGQMGKVAPAQGAIQQVLAKRMQMGRV